MGVSEYKRKISRLFVEGGYKRIWDIRQKLFVNGNEDEYEFDAMMDQMFDVLEYKFEKKRAGVYYFMEPPISGIDYGHEIVNKFIEVNHMLACNEKDYRKTGDIINKFNYNIFVNSIYNNYEYTIELLDIAGINKGKVEIAYFKSFEEAFCFLDSDTNEALNFFNEDNDYDAETQVFINCNLREYCIENYGIDKYEEIKKYFEVTYDKEQVANNLMKLFDEENIRLADGQ